VGGNPERADVVGVRRLTTKEFIGRARLIHGDEYGYTAAKYINTHSKLRIDCKLHGPFWQIAGAHLSGQGCPKCGHIGRVESQRSTTEEFIKKRGSYKATNMVTLPQNTLTPIASFRSTANFTDLSGRSQEPI